MGGSEGSDFSETYMKEQVERVRKATEGRCQQAKLREILPADGDE